MTPRSASRAPALGDFASLGLDARLVDALTALGYEEPTPVQREVIPPLLAGRDVLAQAATGTGKTAAFALPLLHLLTPDAPPSRRTVALILVPTRELAMQVAQAVHRYGKGLGVSVLPVYGGAPMETQLRALKRGVDVVIATPGRALDHIRRRSLRLDAVRMVVLDEADEMLDMGFADDLEAILDATPSERQTALLSATLPPRIAQIAAKHLSDPVSVRVDEEPMRAGSAPRMRQVAYVVPRAHKMVTLARVLDLEQPASTIVFCRTRTEVDEVAEALTARGHRAEALHGGLSQDQRDRVMKRFRGRTTDLLVATDVAARGLDVRHVTHVVNYDVPSAAEAYVHRIGRTGRAGAEGVAITLAEPREQRLLHNIERLTRQRMAVLPIPSVADLRAHRMEQTTQSLRETILAGELDAYRGVVNALADEFGLLDVAAAALRQADTRPAEVEIEIPTLALPTATRRAAKSGRRAGTMQLYIGAGRKLKVRPADLVGAIVGEAGVEAREIGAIQISERHSLVEVPAALADRIISALSASTLKGKKVTVRADRAG